MTSANANIVGGQLADCSMEMETGRIHSKAELETTTLMEEETVEMILQYFQGTIVTMQ